LGFSLVLSSLFVIKPIRQGHNLLPRLPTASITGSKHKNFFHFTNEYFSKQKDLLMINLLLIINSQREIIKNLKQQLDLLGIFKEIHPLPR